MTLSVLDPTTTNELLQSDVICSLTLRTTCDQFIVLKQGEGAAVLDCLFDGQGYTAPSMAVLNCTISLTHA